MKANTWQALNIYKEKFGKDWEADLSKIKNSEEAALVAEIEEAMKKKTRKKVKARLESEEPIVIKDDE